MKIKQIISTVVTRRISNYIETYSLRSDNRIHLVRSP